MSDPTRPPAPLVHEPPPPDVTVEESAPTPAPPSAPPAPEPRRPFEGAPGHRSAASRGDDPQAAVDTREISLAALAEAARRVQPAGEDAEPVVDLVEAERREAAGAPAEDVAPDQIAPEPTDAGSADATVDTGAVEGADADAGEPAGDGEVAAPGAPDRSPIDPRIRERRVAVTRAEGRRRLHILLTVVCVASAIGIAWLVVQSPLLAVRTVNVAGTSRESQAAVRSAARVKDGSALLFVDTGAVARRVEALPWVASARVSRELPNDLTITVVERVPVAWTRRPVPRGAPRGTQGELVVIDRSGRVLTGVPYPPTGVPELVGLTKVPDRGGRIEPAGPAAALAALPDALRAQTRSLTMRHGQGALELAAVSGGAIPPAGEVRLGSLEEIGPKGLAALAVLDQLGVDGEHVRYIDVRVPGAPATR
ncbi:MAG TPA: FtsQ-type POTRA domain-containing protein [Acidimicrobiia bacterium]